MARYDLKKLRTAYKITQKELADKLNVTQGFLSSVEKWRNPFPDERIDDLQRVFPDADLTDYEVPERATHSVYTHWYSKETNAPDAPVIEPKADGVDETKHTYADAPVVYLPESRNPAWPAKDEEETKENPWADELKLQQYRLTVITNELDLDENAPLDEKDPANWKAASYTAILPQLCSLFRNTHVKVNITFKGAGQFAIFAQIQPWGNAGKYSGELVPDITPSARN